MFSVFASPPGARKERDASSGLADAHRLSADLLRGCFRGETGRAPQGALRSNWSAAFFTRHKNKNLMAQSLLYLFHHEF